MSPTVFSVLPCSLIPFIEFIFSWPPVWGCVYFIFAFDSSNSPLYCSLGGHGLPSLCLFWIMIISPSVLKSNAWTDIYVTSHLHSVLTVYHPVLSWPRESLMRGSDVILKCRLWRLGFSPTASHTVTFFLYIYCLPWKLEFSPTASHTVTFFLYIYCLVHSVSWRSFWSCLLVVLNTSSAWMSTSSPRFGVFPVVI